MKRSMITMLAGLMATMVPAVTALAQEAILPKGDPRLQQSAEERAKREDIRDSRLKQQGQGPNYRVEGEPHPSPGLGGAPDQNPNGLARQDTGLADPSVNPGQAAGMQRVQGRIIQSEADTHVVRQLSGPDTKLVVDARTKGDTDLHPGDVVTGFVTAQGRAVMVHKERRPQ
jgi:hypothetical protein